MCKYHKLEPLDFCLIERLHFKTCCFLVTVANRQKTNYSDCNNFTFFVSNQLCLFITMSVLHIVQQSMDQHISERRIIIHLMIEIIRNIKIAEILPDVAVILENWYPPIECSNNYLRGCLQ